MPRFIYKTCTLMPMFCCRPLSPVVVDDAFVMLFVTMPPPPCRRMMSFLIYFSPAQHALDTPSPLIFMITLSCQEFIYSITERRTTTTGRYTPLLSRYFRHASLNFTRHCYYFSDDFRFFADATFSYMLRFRAEIICYCLMMRHALSAAVSPHVSPPPLRRF